MSIPPIPPSSSSPLAFAGASTSATSGVAQAALRAGALALGVAPASLRTALRQGATLPALAQAHGVAPQRAQDAMTGTLRQKLDAGVITQTQFTKLQQLAAELASNKLSYGQYLTQAAVVG